MKMAIEVSEARKKTAYEDLCRGSDPRLSFFLLVAISTLIAAFGLVMNSTAVVIGAMLVAPLMTPILGLSLGLVRGDVDLIRIASKAEIIGVLISIMAGILIGYALPDYFTATNEMLGRTHPNLFDLLVAVLAGLAGAYALVDDKLSPVLPGVAISTAIVPPLANCGLCIALGAYDAARGSFLLFFTNFLSILLVSAAVFSLAGMSIRRVRGAGIIMLKRFGIPVLGLAIVAVFLSVELRIMFEDINLRNKISLALKRGFEEMRVSNLSELIIEKSGATLTVLANVQAPDVVGPRTVAILEQQLEQATDREITLYIRTGVTHDVSATGRIGQSMESDLEGMAPARSWSAKVELLSAAEQVIREYLEKRRGFSLDNLRLMPFDDIYVLIADMSGFRSLTLAEIGEIESLIGKQFADDRHIRLMVMQEVAELTDRYGLMRSEFTLPRDTSEDERRLIHQAKAYVDRWIAPTSFQLHGWAVTILDEKYHMLLEILGPELFTAEQRSALNEGIQRDLNVPVELYVRSQLESVVGPKGNLSFRKLLDEYRERNREAYADTIDRSILLTR